VLAYVIAYARSSDLPFCLPFHFLTASADFFVFPSTNETFGNVVLEAMASGLPVIVTDRMGPRELVADGVTGFVTRTPAEFAERVDWLASHPRERAVMAVKARRVALGRNWQAVFDRLIQDYRELVSNCRAPDIRQPLCLAAMKTGEAQ